MFGDEPVVHRVLRDLVVVIGRAFEAGEALVGGERGQDVAARWKSRCRSGRDRGRRS